MLKRLLALIIFLTIFFNCAAQVQMPPKQNKNAHKHNMDMNMHGMYGLYPMTRDASGTSWEPDSSPELGINWMKDNWMLMIYGDADLIYDNQGGPRGDQKTLSTNMFMFMAQKDWGDGTFGFRSMISLDPLMGKSGYPLLFQTGETADGVNPLIDRQHPHNFVMELAPTYSIPLSDHSSAFLYAGLAGEPALGPPAFMHRFSAMDNPEAPLAHHWLDSTHISYGVVTAGYIWRNFKIEGSAFNGHEPDQYRWNIEPAGLSSYSGRLSYNPTANWSLQVSRGHLEGPEQLEPNVNIDRTSASAIYNKPFNVDDNWATTLAWGLNSAHPGDNLNAILLESEINLYKTHTFFGRFETVQENELFAGDAQNNPFYVMENPSLATDIFTVNKLSLGYIYDFWHFKDLLAGVGGLGSTYAIPSALQAVYGQHPFSFMLFGRIKIA